MSGKSPGKWPRVPVLCRPGHLLEACKAGTVTVKAKDDWWGALENLLRLLCRIGEGAPLLSASGSNASALTRSAPHSNRSWAGWDQHVQP